MHFCSVGDSSLPFSGALVVLGCLWLYGFIGVKAGWIGPTEVPGLNAVSHSGAEAAGGVTAAAKAKIGL